MLAKPDKTWVLYSLAICQLAFLVFLPFDAGQEQIFPYSFLCDFRSFISPTIESSSSYVVSGVCAKDACYPPFAYDLINCLFGSSIGSGHHMTITELKMVVSLALLQCLGLLLFVRAKSDVNVSLAAIAAITPAFLCPLLRANPIGWAFGLVCVFIALRDSRRQELRMLGGLALAIAVALKLSPCIYAMLLIALPKDEKIDVRWKLILFAALVSVALVFVPFFWHGGFAGLAQWIENASANAKFYSCDEPIWGFVPFATRFTKSTPPMCIVQLSLILTQLAALAFVMLVPFCQREYQKLLLLGSAMSFVTYHDYGALYLLPAFFAWLCADNPLSESRLRIICLLSGACWVLIFMPLQVYAPMNGATNYSLQGEAQLILSILAVIEVIVERSGVLDVRGNSPATT